MDEAGEGMLRDWADEALHQLASLAQGALDLAAWGLVSGILWLGAPSPRAPEPPLPMVQATCLADCIETVALGS